MSERTHTIHWQDPAPSAQAARELDGITFFQKMIAGEIPQPPIAKTMGMAVIEADVGRVVFGIEPGERHYNPIGMVHGGVAATLLDSAAGCAVHSGLPAGAHYTTIELGINYVRAITVDTGPLHAIGTIIHLGRRLATAEAKLVDTNGKLYAHATTTCMVFSGDK